MNFPILSRTLLLPFLFAAVPSVAISAQEKTADAGIDVKAAESLRKEMAKIEAMIVVDRDLKNAHASLVQLITRLAEQSGKQVSEEMIESLSQLVLEETLEGKGLGVAGSDPLAVLTRMEESATVVRTGDFFLPRRGGTTDEASQTPQDRMESMVREALRSNHSLIYELGSVAGPALARIVEEDLDAYPAKYTEDPLYFLVYSDPFRAGKLITRNLDLDGVFWKKRVVRALSRAKVFEGTASESRYAQVPALTRILEALLRDPQMRSSAQGLLQSYAEYRPLTPAMREVFHKEISSDVEADRSRGKLIFYRGRKQLPDVSLFEGLLSSDVDDVRVFAASMIAKAHVWSDALALRATDTNVKVRRHVASMLFPEEEGEYPPEDVGKFLALFERLAFDEDVEVRTRVAMSLQHLPRSREWTPEYDPKRWSRPKVEVFTSTPSPRSLLQLGRDPAPQVSAHIAEHLAAMPIDVCEALLVGLSIEVPRSIDPTTVMSRLRPRTRPQETAQVLYGILGQLSRGSSGAVMANEVRAGLSDLPGWNETFLRTIVDGADPVVGAKLLQDSPAGAFGRVSVETLKAALRMLDQTTGSRATLWSILQAIPENATLISAAKQLATDKSVSAEARFWASIALHAADTEQFVAGIRAGIAGTWWREGEMTWRRLEKEFWKIPTFKTDALALQAVSLALIRDPSVPYECAEAMVRQSVVLGSLDTSRAVVEHWFDRLEAQMMVSRVLVLMGTTPALRDDEQLARAVASGNRTLISAVAQTIGELRDPKLLPLLAECVERYPNSIRAMEAAVGFLSDEAAEILLRAAELAPDPVSRKRSFAHLESLREYSLARDYWRRNQIAQRERTSVVSDLLSMLDSDQPDDVRIEAARGLATYRAEEAIPDLIRLMQSGSEPVRKAAKEALDRINSPTPMTKAVETEDGD